MPGSDSALVDDNPLSVATGRSMEAIAADKDRVWDSGKGEVDVEPPPPAKPAPRKTARSALHPEGARKRVMPETVAPQLATLADAAPEGEGWLHEIKYDGYRILAHIAGGTARLLTRNALDWTAKFPALANALAQLPLDSALLDGELVALAPDGSTNFAALQDAISRGQTRDLIYFAFDLLYRDGYDLTGAILSDRKAALANIVPLSSQGMIRYSDHQQGRGPDFLKFVSGYELEGIISKRADRPYRSGRGSDWLKIKCLSRDEFVVIGFTEPGGQRQGLGALILGYHNPQGKLMYGGRVGTGFSDAVLRDLRPRLEKLKRSLAAGSRSLLACRARIRIGLSRAWSPRCNIQTGPPTASCATPRSRGCVTTKPRRKSCTTSNRWPREARAPAPDDAEPAKTRKIGARNAGVPPKKSPIITVRDGSSNFVGVRLTHPGAGALPRRRHHQAVPRRILPGDCRLGPATARRTARSAWCAALTDAASRVFTKST